MGLRLNKVDAITALIFLLVVAGTSLVYADLPATMATHFDAHGNPNGWMPRGLGAWFGVGLGALVWLFVRFGGYLSSEDKRARLDKAPLAWLGLLLVVFLSGVQALLLWVATTPGANLTRGLVLLLGGFSIFLGVLLPKFPPNPVVGVRTFWTLTNEEAWNKTNKVAGIAFVISGAATLVAGLFDPAIAIFVCIASMLGAALVATFVSIVVARRSRR